ncbi:MAG: CoA transferase [Sphingobacteriales bacterium]|nr:MAG: CoA transferase [Sphingobacteriales bacterium]
MFDKLTVIELAGVLAGPAVGMFFAELGAKVVKIENKNGTGDITRTWRLPQEPTDNLSAYYCSVNWNKEIQFVDYNIPDDRNKVYELLKKADLVITNFKSGDDLKFGMDYRTLQQLNPQLIYGQLTAFGPMSDRVGFDVVLQAESGFMFMNGTPQSGPLKMPVALIDVLAAHQLKQGILAALWQRQQTNKGCLVQVSLFDAAVSALANQATNWLMCGHIPQPMGTLHPNIAPYGEVFSCADGKSIVLAVGSDKQFTALCHILQLPKIPADERYSTNEQRVKNRQSLQTVLENEIGQFPNRDSLLDELIRQQVPAGAIRNLAEVFALPEAQALVLTEQMPTGQNTKRVKTAVFEMKT